MSSATSPFSQRRLSRENGYDRPRRRDVARTVERSAERAPGASVAHGAHLDTQIGAAWDLRRCGLREPDVRTALEFVSAFAVTTMR